MEKAGTTRRSVLGVLGFWRPALMAILLFTPIVLMGIVGAWSLWRSERWHWLLWLTPLCWGTCYVLLRRWDRKWLPAWEHDRDATPHWTPRDDAAMQVVHEYQKRSANVQPEQLEDPHFYLQTAMDLALRIARHYHPKAKDPLGSLTIPEILAAAQLALEDSAEWVQAYVPGSTLLSVDQWRALARAPRWVKLATDATWALSLLYNPAALGRYVASRVTMDSATKQIQANVLEAFFRVYVHSVGQYLIEMNSGRLRGGARRYREALARLGDRHPAGRVGSSTAPDAPATSPSSPDVVTVALIGQAGAGKSSLLKALAASAQGVRRQERDTREGLLTIHELTLASSQQQVHVLDTPGYEATDLTAAQQASIHEAARRADVVLVVMNAASPARQTDLQVVQQTLDWFRSQPRFRPPNLLGVLTHIDALSPVLDWDPPYNWQQPSRPKERSIHDAVQYAQELFGTTLRAVIPVATAVEAGRVHGVDEHLVPAMLALLGDARANALLRTLHAEFDDRRFQTVLRQLRNVGSGLLKAYLRPTPGSGKS